MPSLVTSPRYLLHDDPDHPENANRLRAIETALDTSGLRERLTFLNPQPATRDQITAVHSPDYVAALERAMAQAPGYIDTAPTYIVPQSFEIALLAAGGAIAAVDAVLNSPLLPPKGGEKGPGVEGGFALIRPPGHHAIPTAAMGFCLFNNIAIAARHAQTRGQEKIMIVDFDVHHGNGTQDAFYNDPSVFFISTHQAGIYPGSGAAEETGAGAGLGATLNVPLPAGAGDAAFTRVAEEIFVPAADRFRPDFLLISAGYDAHWRDPLASLQLSCTGYARLMQTLIQIAHKHCGGRLALTLEGGYDLDALAGGVLTTMRALLGDDQPPDPLGPARHREPEVSAVLKRVKAIHGL